MAIKNVSSTQANGNTEDLFFDGNCKNEMETEEDDKQEVKLNMPSERLYTFTWGECIEK